MVVVSGGDHSITHQTPEQGATAVDRGARGHHNRRGVPLAVIFGLLAIGTGASLVRNRYYSPKLGTAGPAEQPSSPWIKRMLGHIYWLVSPDSEEAVAEASDSRGAATEARREQEEADRVAERASLEEPAASSPPTLDAMPQPEAAVAAPGYRRFSWQTAALRIETALMDAADNLME